MGYTANLASLLVTSAQRAVVETVDQALAQNIQLCALGAMAPMLFGAFPQLQGVLRSATSSVNLYELYLNGTCGGIIFADYGLSIRKAMQPPNPQICRLILAGKPLFSVPVAQPVSYTVEQTYGCHLVILRTQGAVASIKAEYPEHVDRCADQESSGGTQKMDVDDLFGPVLITSLCVAYGLLAALAMVFGARWKGKEEKAQPPVERPIDAPDPRRRASVPALFGANPLLTQQPSVDIAKLIGQAVDEALERAGDQAALRDTALLQQIALNTQRLVDTNGHHKANVTAGVTGSDAVSSSAVDLEATGEPAAASV
eukprot:NODE_138_length_1227_cov_318.003623_g135_i0.p1 GENE.NODE_138_length_1227_cov_318.003623_g135_i0~~NODE_138_length_1227_cov_318.003623_g135_i0.p1  ORF type:complete len:314 (+),score=27.55 NODE_138_length_1227_cov_318.003623_g135_i0:93-1034(+)